MDDSEAKRHELHDLYSDMYKEAYNVRPRHAVQWSADQLQKAIDSLPKYNPADDRESEDDAFYLRG